MGCYLCNRRTSEPASPPSTQYSWEKKRPVDRSLLIISGEEGSMVGRLPGQLNGSQFRIRDCHGTTILVLDHTNCITIDKCTDCQIFIAPSKGSLCLRDCTNCRCVVACQQFRVRDCKKCIISLFCSTQPVIESSTKLKFTCFQCYYPQLNDQFVAAGLDVFNNCWSNVHDFDIHGYGIAPDTSNWSLIRGEDSREVAPSTGGNFPPIIELPSQGEFSEVGITLKSERSIVPLTQGYRTDEEGCLVIFFEDTNYNKKALEFSHQLYCTSKAKIGFTKRLVIEREQEIQKLFPPVEVVVNDQLVTQLNPTIEAYRAKAHKGSLIGFEIFGEESIAVCHDLLQEDMKFNTGSVYISESAEMGARDLQAFKSITETNLNM